MKTSAFAIALLMSGAAIAQTTTTDTGTTTTGTTTTGTTTTTQPHTDVNANVGTQPTGDVGVDANVDPGTTTTTPTTSTTGTTNSMTTTGQTTTQSHSMPTAMAPASGQTVAPGNDSPERDARGIAVISAPAMVPAGWNGTTGASVGGPVEGGDADYPACSATVTDNCVQTYERGRRSS